MALRRPLSSRTGRIRLSRSQVFGSFGGLVLIVACVFGGVWVNFALQGDAPAAVVRSFCQAEVNQNYEYAFA